MSIHAPFILDYNFDLLNVALKVECCLCYFVICCSFMGKAATLSLNMNGHQKKIGKSGTPVSFLTHQMNHSRKNNRLVINFAKKKYAFSSPFQEFTYHKVKLGEHAGNVFCIIVVSGCLFFLVAIS